jgi:PAT family beta-lactamase induction signal transducer AmpG
MITTQKLAIIWIIGLCSGFTVMISGNTLNFWLSKEQIDLRAISLFALIALPYAVNFFWAPIFDLVRVPFLGKRIGHNLSWILIIQIFLSISVLAISYCSPKENIYIFGIIGVTISFFASAQDTILGAIRTNLVKPEQQGEISGIYIFGYRIGMLLSNSAAIYLSIYTSWPNIYRIFALVIIVFLITIYSFRRNIPIDNLVSDDQYSQIEKFSLSIFLKNILSPIGPFFYIILILALLVLYRLPDNMLSVMLNSFLLNLGYNEFEISSAGKFFGMIVAIVGGLIAGRIMQGRNVFDSLLIFGTIHAFAHLLFIIQDIYGKNVYLLMSIITIEGLTGGMSMAAYIGFIASLCTGKYRATQYSLLSSMMGLSRSTVPVISGYIVVNTNWSFFFFFLSVVTIASLVLIRYLRKWNFVSKN